MRAAVITQYTVTWLDKQDNFWPPNGSKTIIIISTNLHILCVCVGVAVDAFKTETIEEQKKLIDEHTIVCDLL